MEPGRIWGLQVVRFVWYMVLLWCIDSAGISGSAWRLTTVKCSNHPYVQGGANVSLHLWVYSCTIIYSCYVIFHTNNSKATFASPWIPLKTCPAMNNQRYCLEILEYLKIITQRCSREPYLATSHGLAVLDIESKQYKTLHQNLMLYGSAPMWPQTDNVSDTYCPHLELLPIIKFYSKAAVIKLLKAWPWSYIMLLRWQTATKNNKHEDQNSKYVHLIFHNMLMAFVLFYLIFVPQSLVVEDSWG